MSTKEINKNIKFFIPDNQTVPTQLRLLVDGCHVYYDRTPGEFGYDFEVYNKSPDESILIATEIAQKMCQQSYDHGAEWRICSLGLLPDKYDNSISHVVRALFRWKDGY